MSEVNAVTTDTIRLYDTDRGAVGGISVLVKREDYDLVCLMIRDLAPAQRNATCRDYCQIAHELRKLGYTLGEAVTMLRNAARAAAEAER